MYEGLLPYIWLKLTKKHFVFTVEPVHDTFAESLTLQEEEIEDVRFVPVSRIGDYMKEYRVQAVETYLKHRVAGAMIYLEDGLMICSPGHL
jgi:hypothetical protein